MKIGFFTDSYLPMNDGVATSTEQCAQALERLGHEVYIVAPRHPRYKDKRKNVYRLTSVKFIKSPEIRWALQLPERSLINVMRINFDIIHGHSGGGVTFAGLQIARSKRIPYIATYHTMWNRYAHYFLRGKVITPRVLEFTSRVVGNLCDALVAPTERVKTELLTYGIKRPIFVLPSGIELNTFKNVEEGYLRKKKRIPSHKKILLYVGRLGKEKSVDFLIEAFKDVHMQLPDTVLVLVGTGSEKEKLKQLAKKEGLGSSVYFIGNVAHDTIAKVYRDADLFVFASQTETQGMVILEALASGLPVVTLRDEAFKGVIEEGKNGYSLQKDKQLFSQKIISLLNDTKRMNRFSIAARKTAEKFSVDETAKQLEHIYQAMIETQAKKRNSMSLEEFRNFLSKAKMQIKTLSEQL